ncbi:MAG: LemA family protein [Candidatus Absconditabacteria bacterium]|nr:LemA family protein [Candidatus Absconditabacteria bacterium]
MKKTGLIIIAIVLILGLWVTSKYNGLVRLDESVKTAWSQVENVYQRRADLIPNLVNTVKGAAAQEQDVLTSVVEARASAMRTNIDIKDAQALATYQEAQGELSTALGRLLMITENYPELKSIEAFRDLTVQLEGTENRISVERMNYNNTVRAFNIVLRSFPTNIIAKLFGFEQANLFEAEEGSDVAPVVEF